jgi:hypothetical protein
MCILHTGRHPNRLDGLQLTSRTKLSAESAIQSTVPVLQANVTSHDMQAPYIQFPLLAATEIQRLLQRGCLTSRGAVECGGHAHTASRSTTPLRLLKTAPVRETAAPRNVVV